MSRTSSVRRRRALGLRHAPQRHRAGDPERPRREGRTGPSRLSRLAASYPLNRHYQLFIDLSLLSLLSLLFSLLVHLELVLDSVHSDGLRALLVVVRPVVAQVHVLERRVAARRLHRVAALRVPGAGLEPAALEAHEGHELARVRGRHRARELLDVAHHRELRRLVGARPLEREVHLAPSAGHVHRLLVRHEHGLALLVAARLLHVQAPAVKRGRLQRLHVLQLRLDVQHEQHHPIQLVSFSTIP